MLAYVKSLSVRLNTVWVQNICMRSYFSSVHLPASPAKTQNKKLVKKSYIVLNDRKASSNATKEVTALEVENDDMGQTAGDNKPQTHPVDLP